MTETSRGTSPGWLSILLVVLAGLALLWSVSDYRSACRNLDNATADLEESQQLAKQIGQWTRKPPVAALNNSSSQEHNRQITNSLSEAQISSGSVLSIVPAQATRLDNSDYQQRQTSVQLSDVTLPLLAAFQAALDDRSGLYLEDLVLTPSEQPFASNGLEAWDARLTLTHLVYSPTSQ